MDTQDSNWFSRDVQLPYPDYGVSKPPTPLQNPVVERLGPIALSASDGSLVKRWWAAWQSGGNVVIAGQQGAAYGLPVTLFSESATIVQITLTFDQLGRPLVFYKTDTNDIKLYWFDPVLSQNTISVFGQGNYPTAIFDYPTKPGQSFTDAVMFYIGTDTQVKYRKQRDRFAVEYGIPGAFGGRILSAGLTRENRVQVVFR